jgi:Holliday junction resolvase RusA-like endonuclease
MKFTLDALTKAKVWNDDQQVYEIHAKKFLHSNVAHTKISIDAVEIETYLDLD